MAGFSRALTYFGAASGFVLLASCGSVTADDASSTVDREPGDSPDVVLDAPEDATVENLIAPGVKLQSCSTLLRSQWRAPADSTPDINWDPESGVAAFTFGESVVKVNVIEDAACLEVPDLKFFIESIRADHEENKKSECDDLLRRLNSGEVFERDGVKVPREKTVQHLREFCGEK